MTEDEFRKGPPKIDMAQAMDHIEKRIEGYLASSGDPRANLTDYLLIQVLKELRAVVAGLDKINAAMLSDEDAGDLLRAVQEDAASRNAWALTDAERAALTGGWGDSVVTSEMIEESRREAARMRAELDASRDGIGGTDGVIMGTGPLP